MLTQQDKELLLRVARRSIESGFAEEQLSQLAAGSPIVDERMGAFVTLKKRGRLRGCIGFLEGKKPLYETIKEMAQAAAFEDPRFPPVKEDELVDLDIEISVLTPLVQIRDIREIEVGIHGIYIVKGLRSGVLLPQVATEHNWNRTVFLRETCNKAGLPQDAWKNEDTKIFIFSASVFGET